MNLETGPLAQFSYFELGSRQPGRLLIVIHRLVVDDTSWRILLDDLQTLLQQLRHGLPPALPARTTTFNTWARKLTMYGRTDKLQNELAYWLETFREAEPALPVDHPVEGHGILAALHLSINPADTQTLVQNAATTYRAELSHFLLAALVQTVGTWTGDPTVLIDLKDDGRVKIFDDVDLSRTVGSLTTVFPVRLKLAPDVEPGEALKAIKEQVREAARYALGFGVLRCLGRAPELNAWPAAQISFEYRGNFDHLFAPSSPFRTLTKFGVPSYRRQPNARSPLINVSTHISGDQLRVDWEYDESVYRLDTVERLVDHFASTLRSLIAYCRASGEGDFTPSDFPLSRLDQGSLDRLIATDRQVEDIYTLSPTQEGLLFHTRYASGSGVYTAQLRCGLRGSLDVLSFRRAWQKVLDRHPALRTKFVSDGLKEPLQIVCKEVQLPWQQFDWRALSAENQQEQLEVFLQADRSSGFDLSRAPLLRLALFQLAEETYHFVVNLHHLILDGWSIALLMKEVLAYYEALCIGQPVAAQPARPYSDYIRWLQRQDLARPEPFWRQALKGFAEPTQLGVDRKPSHPPRHTPAHAQEQLKLTVETTAALESFGRSSRLTLSIILQGAWALLLSRYSGRDDVLFGITVSGRPAELAEVETIVGLFINTLPVRIRIPAGERCSVWLRALQARQVERQQYEYSRLVDVQAWSEIPRGQSLFETLLAFENYPVDAGLRHQGSALQVDSVTASGQTNYPLILVAVPGTELSLEISYDPERFDRATIGRLLGHLTTLLRGMVSNPEQRLSEVPMLAPAEQHKLLVEWNDTAATTPPFGTIHQWFEAQVERAPDSVAMVFEDHQISYGVLNERANRLAGYLRTVGVGPEVPVGICMDRSLETIVGILSVLKAGVLTCRLNPAYPEARLALMLADSQVPIILTQAHLAPTLPKHTAQVISLDRDWEMFARFSPRNQGNEAQADSLAYVIYTSGSTGTPKGVQVDHRSLVAYIGTAQRAFDLTPDDRVLQFASMSFDTSIEEICGCLTTGATLVLRSRSMLNSAEVFLRQCRELALTVLDLPTAYWGELAASPELLSFGFPSSLRLVVIGGERASSSQLAQWHNWHLQAGKHVQLLNAYGPTEATIAATMCELSERPSGNPLMWPVPIGRPIQNVQGYVLDQQLNAVPVGVPGELYIGGAGITRGYRNRPALTAERFIPNPFSEHQGARLYWTGDRVRHLRDGNLEFLGRVDQQVKIRGFRVELGEIEATLRQYSAVREVAVVAEPEHHLTDSSSAVAQIEYKRLVAYFVADPESESAPDALRNFMQQKLPPYMLPSIFVRLDEFPRTPSGKIDRSALPATDPFSARIER